MADIPRGDWFCTACRQVDPELPANATTGLAAPAPAKRPTLLAELVGKWDGHTIRKASKGPGALVTGPARFLGSGVGARCYAVTFSDGSEQRFTHGAVEKLRVW